MRHDTATIDCRMILVVLFPKGHKRFFYIQITCIWGLYGVYKGVHYFSNFALKHRLGVLVRTALLTCSHNLCFEQK